MESIHATSIAFDDTAVLIKGVSGSGKSTVALELISLGAKLIADDQTVLSVSDERVYLSAPSSLPKGLEVRGIGIVSAPICDRARLKLVVDLSELENERLPNVFNKTITILGYAFPFFPFQGRIRPAASIYALLKFGAVDV